MKRLSALAFLLLAALAPAGAHAIDLSVGSGAGCDHDSLQAALLAIRNQPGSHTIRLRKETHASPNGVIYAPSVDQGTVSIEGGYAECGDTAPGSLPDDVSVLDGSGGLERPALRLLIAGRVGSVQIRRLTIRGGDALEEDNAYNGAGGGLSIRGPASVLLGRGASVRDNRAVRGGGIALVGGRLDLFDSATPERVDLYLVEGASVSGNEALDIGGGLYCGGGIVDGAPTFASRHGSIVVQDAVIGFNQAGTLGGAFHCHGTVEGGGGFQPRPGDGQAVLIVGNRAASNCAAGSATFDTLVPMGADGFRPIGAADGSNGIVAIASNEGGGAALCIGASRSLGSDTKPEGPSTFRLQNLVITGQSGTGPLGLSLDDPQARLRVKPSGRHVACSFFEPTPCVSFTGNVASATPGTGGTTPLIAGRGQIELFRANIRDNDVRTALFSSLQGAVVLVSTLVVDNTVQASAASTLRSVFLAREELGQRTDFAVVHSTVAFDTPLDRFFSLDQADSTALARASIFVSTTPSAPANVGGAAPPANLRREWCGFFQSSADFATHTELPDPTSGQFETLGPGDKYALDPTTYVPAGALRDRCTRSVEDDFYGNPFGSSAPSGGTTADIGAVENRDDVIFEDGFD
jgi:hypothetical protein